MAMGTERPGPRHLRGTPPSLAQNSEEQPAGPPGGELP